MHLVSIGISGKRASRDAILFNQEDGVSNVPMDSTHVPLQGKYTLTADEHRRFGRPSRRAVNGLLDNTRKCGRRQYKTPVKPSNPSIGHATAPNWPWRRNLHEAARSLQLCGQRSRRCPAAMRSLSAPFRPPPQIWL